MGQTIHPEWLNPLQETCHCAQRSGLEVCAPPSGQSYPQRACALLEWPRVPETSASREGTPLPGSALLRGWVRAGAAPAQIGSPVSQPLKALVSVTRGTQASYTRLRIWDLGPWGTADATSSRPSAQPGPSTPGEQSSGPTLPRCAWGTRCLQQVALSGLVLATGRWPQPRDCDPVLALWWLLEWGSN